MRYFKFSDHIPTLETIQRSAAVQRQHRKSKWLQRAGTLVFWVVFLLLAGIFLYLTNWIMPDEEGVVFVIVRFVGVGLLSGFSIILAAVLAAVVASPLWGKRQNTEKALLREALSEACAELKAFYGFCEPFIVTKCYHSSDRRFDRHDVCLFVVDGELRVTANLQYGFFDLKRDLGCYCLTREEITLRQTTHKDRSAVELCAGETAFVLGAKAHSFVQAFLQTSE